MISPLLLTAALVVWFPYTLAAGPDDKLRINAPNGELLMNIVRWVEDKGKDVNRVVRLLDSSSINIEPNEPYVVHRRRKPLKSDDASEVIWKGNISEPGFWSLDGVREDLLNKSQQSGSGSFGSRCSGYNCGLNRVQVKEEVIPQPIFTKKLSTTWTWSRQHDMNYTLNVSQPAYKKVPADSLFKVGTKNYWEFKTKMTWRDADKECRAAGLKLAQPKTHNEVIYLQKELHKRIHGRESGCKDDTWTKHNGYCFKASDGFLSKVEALQICKNIDSTLPYPALGNATAWRDAIAFWDEAVKSTTGRRVGTPHAGAYKALDGQWLWDDGEDEDDQDVVADESWTPGKPGTEGKCSATNAGTGLLMDKSCTVTWKGGCQGKSTSHWLGALGSAEVKCVEWVGGKCIEEEDHEQDKHIIDLWQTEPGDILSEQEEYALQLQIEHERPFTVMKTTDKRPFICESACPLGFVNYGTECLLINKFWLTWREASAKCIEMGLHLYETEEKQAFEDWLKEANATGGETYWIGGSERSSAGELKDITKIKKLQFICEMVQGTRQMNVTDPLSYEDEQKDFKLPKFETKCSNRTVKVYERKIEETYPFSVQMDITGWMWVEYNKETDEHGSNQCDNNGDFVGGEDCWAHSKWGYSCSYLQNGDEICAHGDNARLTLNGTVTYEYNQYEVKVNNEECESDRSKRSVGERKSRRSKRSIASEKTKNKIKTKANSQELDDNNKPLMSYIGKRAAEWVRAQAKERGAHLVEYHIDKLSTLVTDMSLEEKEEELMTPGSIFEEEFENTGSTNVITTFKKTKTISNSYRWSVKKGLNIEDSHISSYNMKDTESGSNSFSVANNIAQKEGTSQSTNQGAISSERTSSGTSTKQGRDSKSTKSITDEEIIKKGITNTEGTGQQKSLGDKSTEGIQTIEETKTDVSSNAVIIDSESIKTGVSDTISTGRSNTNEETNKKTKTDTNSQSSTRASYESSSNSKSLTEETSTSETTGGEITTQKSGASWFGLVSFGSSKTTKAPERTESTRSSETSTSSSSKASMDSRTSTSSQTKGSENSLTTSTTDSQESSKKINNEVNKGQTTSKAEGVSNTQSLTNQNKVENSRTSTSSSSATAEETASVDETSGQTRGISDETSLSQENQATLTQTQDRVKSIEEKISKTQESIRSMESTVGRIAAKASEESRGTQKGRTQQVTIDKNEDVETSSEEVLDTQNEVVIPPETSVKIEWNVEQRKVRLPWKASVVLTGWINVRFKNKEDEVCDIFHETDVNPYSNTSWTYNYTNPCEKDNRLYGFPLSYLEDENFIKEGNGLRFTASGVFEAVVATSHFLKVTEFPAYNYNKQDNSNDDSDYDDGPNDSRRRRRSPRIMPSDYGLEYDDYEEEPRVNRRKRAPRVTKYPMDFDENGNGRIKNNRHFRKFQANQKFNGMY